MLHPVAPLGHQLVERRLRVLALGRHLTPGTLDEVQGLLHGALPDPVDGQAQPVAQRLRGHGGHVGSVVVQDAAGVRALEGLLDRGGAPAHGAVQDELHALDPHHVVAQAAADPGADHLVVAAVEVAELQCEVPRAEPGGQLPRVLQAQVGAHLHGPGAHVVHRGEPPRRELPLCHAHPGQELGGLGGRQVREGHGLLLQQPGGLAVLVPHDAPSRGVRGLPRDAHAIQRRGVHQGHVRARALEEHGVLRGRLVQVRAGGATPVHAVLVVAPPGDPLADGGLSGGAPDRLDDVARARCGGRPAVRLQRHPRVRSRVAVGLDETGHQVPPARVHHRHPGCRAASYLARVPHEGDDAVLDHHRLRLVQVLPGRSVHHGVDDGHAACVVSCHVRFLVSTGVTGSAGPRRSGPRPAPRRGGSPAGPGARRPGRSARAPTGAGWAPWMCRP